MTNKDFASNANTSVACETPMNAHCHCRMLKCRMLKCQMLKCTHVKCSNAQMPNAQMPNAQMPNAQMLKCPTTKSSNAQMSKCRMLKCQMSKRSNALLPNRQMHLQMLNQLSKCTIGLLSGCHQHQARVGRLRADSTAHRRPAAGQDRGAGPHPTGSCT